MIWWLKNSFLYDFFGKRSFSQTGEDMILRHLISDKRNGLPAGRQGFYVDVGAFHPKVFSNTYYFYKKGWKGINIEPNREMWKLFGSSRKRDVNLNMGVSDKRGKFAYINSESPALNKFSKKGGLKILCLPLSDILSKYLPKGQMIDFMSIDVEGMELSVLKSNNWRKFCPKILIVEKRKGVKRYLLSLNYRLVSETPLSLLFMLKS
jgi:FkbM family methyltransferase